MDFYKLSKTVLFQGATPEETEQMLSCLKAGKRKYKKEEMIYRVGEVVSCIGIVLSGSVLIENDDIWGNRSVLERAGEGEIFAETYASIPDQKMLVNVIAAEDTEILFLNVGKMLHLCSNSCIFHNELIKNLLQVSAQKNLALSRRIFNTSSKSIRGRLLSYLSNQAVLCNSKEFDIPFNRQQLADYEEQIPKAMHQRLEQEQERTRKVQEMLPLLMERNLRESRQQLAIRIERMKGLSPLAKLNQGFSYVQGSEGTVKKVADVKKGDWLRIYVTDGQIEAQVTDTKKE